jgi:hypothetical protein
VNIRPDDEAVNYIDGGPGGSALSLLVPIAHLRKPRHMGEDGKKGEDYQADNDEHQFHDEPPFTRHSTLSLSSRQGGQLLSQLRSLSKGCVGST